MITSHHLGVSQPSRLALLMQVPEQPCELNWYWYNRSANVSAPLACPDCPPRPLCPPVDRMAAQA